MKIAICVTWSGVYKRPACLCLHASLNQASLRSDHTTAGGTVVCRSASDSEVRPKLSVMEVDGNDDAMTEGVAVAATMLSSHLGIGRDPQFLLSSRKCTPLDIKARPALGRVQLVGLTCFCLQ